MWKLEYTTVAEKSIRSLSYPEKKKIKNALESLQINPDLGKQLVGPLKGLRSLRVGDYRIIHKKENNDLIILVVAVGHRKDIYKKF